jgi:hypothetical protein
MCNFTHITHICKIFLQIHMYKKLLQICEKFILPNFYAYLQALFSLF